MSLEMRVVSVTLGATAVALVGGTLAFFVLWIPVYLWALGTMWFSQAAQTEGGWVFAAFQVWCLAHWTAMNLGWVAALALPARLSGFGVPRLGLRTTRVGWGLAYTGELDARRVCYTHALPLFRTFSADCDAAGTLQVGLKGDAGARSALRVPLFTELGTPGRLPGLEAAIEANTELSLSLRRVMDGVACLPRLSVANGRATLTVFGYVGPQRSALILAHLANLAGIVERLPASAFETPSRAIGNPHLVAEDPVMARLAA